MYDLLPSVQRFEFDDPPEGEMLEFRLLYKGPLPVDSGEGGKTKYKHQIRKYLHKQLRELWIQHPSLRRQSQTLWVKYKNNPTGGWFVEPLDECPGAATLTDSSAKPWTEHLADDHTCAGGRWVPLVNEVNGFTCSLDILFLRRDGPGGLVRHGGDIDNRIKTLMDGLQKPKKVSDLGNLPIDADENPFYVLLEDDKLITGISITTDRLLISKDDGEKDSWVELVIDVKVSNPHALFVDRKLV
jgi:hypothetical protein